jgi:hypothetical protein
MLGQLICVDRRYQRMNCFNIREVQSMLKQKFFADLNLVNEQHRFLNKTMVGLRFKDNNDTFRQSSEFLLAVYPSVNASNTRIWDLSLIKNSICGYQYLNSRTSLLIPLDNYGNSLPSKLYELDI